MALVATTVRGMKADIVAYLEEMYTLLPKAARFLSLVVQALLAIVLAPMYGVFGFSLYLWSEAGWGEKLSAPQRFMFWTIVIPVSAAQWYMALSVMKNYGLLH